MNSAAHADHAHDTPSTCLNCGTAVSGNFCQHCGQETVLHPPSAREFLHEFIGHYVALEGRLLGTVGRLLFRPGALTNEYVAGRRVRFVQPLRLYLTLSVLFFALAQFTHGVDLPVNEEAPAKVKPASGTARAAVRALQPKPDADSADDVRDASDTSKDSDLNDADDIAKGAIAWLHRVWPAGARHADHFEQLSPAEKGRILVDGIYQFAPYAMFCLMPLFALYLKVLYLGSGRRYGEHLLFALHTNAFAFVMFMCMLLPLMGVIKFGLWLWLLAYLPWAMRRVYRGSRIGTAWRWLTLMSVYSLSMAFGFLFTVGAGVLAAG